MELQYANIELINANDVAMASRHFIKVEEIKRISENILVNNSVHNLCINEKIQLKLKLPHIENKFFKHVNGNMEEFEIVGPINLKYKSHTTVCNALILKNDSQPVLGNIIFEQMNNVPIKLPYLKSL